MPATFDCTVPEPVLPTVSVYDEDGGGEGVGDGDGDGDGEPDAGTPEPVAENVVVPEPEQAITERPAEISMTCTDQRIRQCFL